VSLLWQGTHFQIDLSFISPSVIVCIDACFTQKRHKTPGNGDDVGIHYALPSTFLPEEDVQAMERYVDQCRAVNGGSHSRQEDRYEGPLKVPASILDGCNESFTAADERRHKASTQFFSDTGLMAMLCRHDWVLWLANMTSAGEKQHYALALLEKLFKNIPKTLTVGLLYNIACQLHRSFIKRHFFPQYLSRSFLGYQSSTHMATSGHVRSFITPASATGSGYLMGRDANAFGVP
jgi:hypothetical protein